MEYFDIRNEDGTVTGEVKERNLVHIDGDLHGTVHVWLLRYKDDQLQVLLQKRCNTKDAFPGYYDVSSAGHILAGEEPLPSAMRELYEELGIQVTKEQLHYIGTETVYMEDEFYDQPFRNYEISSIYVCFMNKEIEQMALQDSEVESVVWMDYNECLQKLTSGELRHCINVEEFKMVKMALEQYE